MCVRACVRACVRVCVCDLLLTASVLQEALTPDCLHVCFSVCGYCITCVYVCLRVCVRVCVCVCVSASVCTCVLGESGGGVCGPNSQSIHPLLSAFFLLLRSVFCFVTTQISVWMSLKNRTAIRYATCLLLSVLILRTNTELQWRQPHSL